MFWVVFCSTLESVFLGCPGLSPSVCGQILISLKLLLFLLEAACHGYEPAFEMLLFDGILWHDEFVVVKAFLVFGGGHVIVILLLSVCRSVRRAGFSILLC